MCNHWREPPTFWDWIGCVLGTIMVGVVVAASAALTVSMLGLVRVEAMASAHLMARFNGRDPSQNMVGAAVLTFLYGGFAGLVFMGLVEYLVSLDTQTLPMIAGLGLLWGAALWGLSFAWMNVVRRGPAGVVAPRAGMSPAVGKAVSYLAYGLVLGVLAGLAA